MIQQEQERVITHHTVTLGPLTREGDAQVELVRQDADGTQHTRLLRVPAGLPGERVTIAVEEPPPPRSGRRSRRWKPRPPKVWITELHEASQLRTIAPCPVFGTCGGCQLQHMQYAAQLEWKRDVVRQLLQEIGGFDNPPLLPTVPCDIPWHYRNHMRFSVNREGKPGLTARGTHRVLPLQECPIAEENINRALSILSRHENPRPQALVRCSAYSQQVMIQPVPPQEVAAQLAESGLDLHTETMEETLVGATFRIRPSSFFQTNTAQAEKMAQMVLSGLLPTNDQSNEAAQQLTVVDAYCGVGTFALLLARHVGKVIAIEESASAIKDAQWNMRTVENVEILKGKVEAMLPTLSSRIDGLVIDPPRAGCQQVVLDALIQHPVSRIVYVSCEPSTLARDLNILCHLHPVYRLRTIQPLDMFPQTAHIESVAVLEHVESGQQTEDTIA
ncbi:23S rRNA (uracil-5-)-methyltransferase RumA [Reticulibacter mediterranei]|uniref:23S rRNA (Uracil-5-)-methyltransferase RumA n=1 Tax=Reticulibacter mediterranei TaxID=2778369 RepID=A0A8J3IHJ2_9CHLR|nr:class I SAM-dependent RNA methyltransferase [Reticulibacter mediterranei]GHO95684.1 23S rRNA (uracil-5-)-methyltransferase RumA [Reticulibacter mediterranei]